MSEDVRGVETAKDPTTVELSRVRRLWHLLEPLHAVLYYAPEVFEEVAALGYDTEERWPSYFPLRAAPLGLVGSGRVTSAFYSFNPRMVAEHMDSAWSIARPDVVLKARLRGMDRAYRAIFGDRIDSPELAEAAALARRAAEAADTTGRPSPRPTPSWAGPKNPTSNCGRRRRSCANTGATATSPPSSSPASTRSSHWSPSPRSVPPPSNASRAGAGARTNGRRHANAWSPAAS